jgi:hypothetical protein
MRSRYEQILFDKQIDAGLRPSGGVLIGGTKPRRMLPQGFLVDGTKTQPTQMLSGGAKTLNIDQYAPSTTNPWVQYLRQIAAETGRSYTDVMQDPQVNANYHNRGVKKSKSVGASLVNGGDKPASRDSSLTASLTVSKDSSLTTSKDPSLTASKDSSTTTSTTPSLTPSLTFKTYDPWQEWCKQFAMEHNITYLDAKQNKKCKSQYIKAIN